jgi:hypothetical protein
MFRLTWPSFGAMKIAVETATLSSLTPMNTVDVPACCYTSVTWTSNCVSASRMEYICVSHNVPGCLLTFSVGCFLLRVVCCCLV